MNSANERGYNIEKITYVKFCRSGRTLLCMYEIM